MCFGHGGDFEPAKITQEGAFYADTRGVREASIVGGDGQSRFRRMAQLTERAIERGERRSFVEPFAPRGIGHDAWRFASRVDAREGFECAGERSDFELDCLRDACALRIGTCGFDGTRIAIAREDTSARALDLVFGLLTRFAQCDSIVERSVLESKRTMEAGGAMFSEERGFDGDRPRSTHRIDEEALTIPIRSEDERTGDIFSKRGAVRILAIATTMKRLTRSIERKRASVFVNPREERNEGPFIARFVAETSRNSREDSFFDGARMT